MRTLVLGGTRSGKSARAEDLVSAAPGEVVYVATARLDRDDPEMAARVRTHQERRPADWVTVESADLPSVLTEHPEATVLVDDLGGWVTSRLDARLAWSDGPRALDAEIADLLAAVDAHRGEIVFVSPEVGLGVIPATSSGRLFADLLGGLNARLAQVCDRTEFVVAGRVLPLGGTPGELRGTDSPAAVSPASGAVAASPTAASPAVAVPPSDAGEGTPPPTTTPPTTPPPDGEFPAFADLAHYEDAVQFDRVTEPAFAAADAARARQRTLTKPAGSLGRLEELSVWISACQDSCPPRPLDRVRVVVFAGDHGVAAHGVSAYPREVTVQMVSNIESGGAAVSVLARAAGASVRVADLAVLSETSDAAADHKVRRGSGSIDREDALDADEVRAAVAAGRRIADEEVDAGADLLVAGDLGIGNTTPATALVSLVTGREPVAVVGRGTGVDDEGWMRKTAAIRDAVFRARHDVRDPVALLRRAGGADLAAMAGFLAQAAVRRTPVLLDGSVVTAAALCADTMAPGARGWWRAGHRSAEPAHGFALEHLGLEPLLDLGMRLGEGSGALAALPLVHSAVAVLREMATFDDAGVSERDAPPTGLR